MSAAHARGENPNDPQVIAKYVNFGPLDGLPLWQGKT